MCGTCTSISNTLKAAMIQYLLDTSNLGMQNQIFQGQLTSSNIEVLNQIFIQKESKLKIVKSNLLYYDQYKNDNDVFKQLES